MLVGWLNAVGICVSSLLDEATVVVTVVLSVPLDSVAELLVNVLAVMLGI